MTNSMQQGFLAVLFNGNFGNDFHIARSLLFVLTLCLSLERQTVPVTGRTALYPH